MRIQHVINKFIFIIIILLSGIKFTSAASLDSLFIDLKRCKNEKEKVNAMSRIAYEYTNSNIDSASQWIDKALLLAQKIKFKNGIANASSIKGIIYEIQGKYDLAIKQHLECLKISVELKDTNNISSSLNNIAIVYDYKGDYQKSLDYQFQSLNYALQLNDSNNISNSYLNIGIVYYYLGIFEKALDYTFRGLKIQEKINNREMQVNYLNNIGMIYGKQNKFNEALDYYFKTIDIYKSNNNKLYLADAYNNVGVTYLSLNNYDIALEYLTKSKVLKQEVGHVVGIAQALSNIGLVYKAQKKFDEAEKCYTEASKIQTEIGDKNGLSNILSCFGDLYFETKDYTKAKTYYLKAESLSKEIGANEQILSSYKGLSKLYFTTLDYKQAYLYYDKLATLEDSINSYENNQKMIRLESDYEFEKKQELINFENKKKELAARNELQKQKLYRNFYLFGFGLMIILSIVIYRSYRHKKKANKILSEQKLQIQEQNEELKQQKEEIETQRDLVTLQKNKIETIHLELTDSIHYAKRIQAAILPTFNIQDNSIFSSFVLFKPCKIVSGDFYWTKTINNNFIFCVADCTGHGVPGAFMSMLGISLLNGLVKKENTIVVSEILNQLRANIITSLQQHGVTGEQKDGMDISLCILNLENNILQFAGANNPIYIVKKSILIDSENGETRPQLYEIKGDKMPLAIYERMESFTHKEIQLNKGDSVYLFSDGYADQFGGPNNKKFMYKQFKEMILTVSDYEMNKQKEELEIIIDNWMSNNEQVDDITILGLKIT